MYFKITYIKKITLDLGFRIQIFFTLCNPGDCCNLHYVKHFQDLFRNFITSRQKLRLKLFLNV